MPLLPFELKDLEGKSASLGNLRMGAKLTAIVFWATWSESSIKEIKKLMELDPLQGKGLRVIAVNAEEENPSADQLAAVGAAAKGFPAGFAALLDDHLSTFRDYGVSAVPTTFLADRNGVVVFRLAGFPVIGGERMLTYIRETLDDRPIAPGPWAYRPNPRSVRYFHLARILLSKGDHEMAVHTLRRAAEIDPQYLRPHALMGDIEKAAGRFEAALAHYSQALKFDPKNPQVLTESGECLLLAGEIEKGLNQIRLALAQETDNGLIRAHLAFGLELLGKRPEADAEFKRAATLAPRDPRIHALEGRVYERRGMKAEALAAYWQAYDLLSPANLRKAERDKGNKEEPGPAPDGSPKEEGSQ